MKLLAMKLFMLLLGCTPPGRNTEQHDIFFGIAEKLKDLIPEIKAYWPEANGKIHIDAWRQVNYVDGRKVQIIERSKNISDYEEERLFFINLGGYKQNEFEEFHYKMLVACKNKSVAIKQAKASAFYKHVGYKGAESHIDDKYGVDVDDIFQIEDILSEQIKTRYGILLSAATGIAEDEVHLGYFRLDKL